MPDEPKNWRDRAKEDLEDSIQNLEKAFVAEEKLIIADKVKQRAYYPSASYWYWALVAMYLSAQVGVGCLISVPLTVRVISVGFPVNVGWLVLLLQSLHFVASLHSIGVNSLSGVTFFGRPLYAPKSGLYVIPFGITSLIQADRNYKDKRFPGPADKIFRVSKKLQEAREGGDMPPVGSGLVRPIFVMTGEPRLSIEDMEKIKNERGGNPVDRQLSVEISYFVRYRPDENYGGIFRIARNLSADTGKIDTRIEDLVREQSERDMKSILTQLTPATITENIDLVNKVFILKMRLAVMRLGIDIDSKGAGLAELNLSHDTNEEQAKVARAEFRKKAVIIEADGDKTQRILRGEGDAGAEGARLEAEAKGRRLMMTSLNVDGNAVLASEAARNVLEKTNVILAGAGGGMKDILGLVVGAQSVLTTESKTVDTKKKDVATEVMGGE